MSVYDDLRNANLPIDHPDHPFGIERYRAMAANEIKLGQMVVDAGKAAGDSDWSKRGEVFLGLRLAVDDEENARLERERDAMWAWVSGHLEALGYPGINSGAREEGA